MKTKNIYIIVLFVIGLLMVSCENDIEFKGDDTTAMMVVNSLLTPDSVVKVHLSKSKFFLKDDSSFEVINDAVVNVYANDVFVEELDGIGGGFYLGSYKPKHGEIIKIVANNSEFGTVSSSTFIYPENPIISVDTVSNFTGETFWVNYTNDIKGNFIQDTLGKVINKQLKFTVNFKDDLDTKNYYRLVVKYRQHIDDVGIIDNTAFIESTDLVFGSTSEGDIFQEGTTNYYHEFSDEILNGKKYGLTFTVNTTEYEYMPGKEPVDNGEVHVNVLEKQELVINLQSISDSYYLYLKSRSANNSYIEFFSEPVQIHNNIQNGIGIIGSFTPTFFIVDLPLKYSMNYYSMY